MIIEKTYTGFRCEIELTDNNDIKNKIENSPYLKKTFQGNKITRYIAEYEGYAIDIRLLTQKMVLLCKNDAVIKHFVSTLF